MNKFPYNKEVLVDNILEVYECCSGEQIRKGRQWYQTANQICSDIANRHRQDLITTIGVLSALSPMSSWDWNIINTSLYFQGQRKHTGNQLSKCDEIVKTNDYDEICKILNGRKIVSFFNNILSPYGNEFVTIDRHSLTVAGIKLDTCTDKQYDFLRECYIEAGNRVGLKAPYLQAATWIYIRENKLRKNGKL